MTIQSAALAIKPTLQLHSKFRGDAESVIRAVAKKDANKPLNNNITPQLVYLDTNQLVPLESQRTTKAEWTKARLIELGGLDMWAFGTLSVCLDPRDGVYYVWDGCGRLALAQIHGLSQVPCVVIEGAKEQAAFYFGYNQERGRRTLSKEVLFVNRAYSGDPSALDQVGQLTTLGLYIKGDTDYSVPHPTPSNDIEIGYRAFSEGVKMAQGNITLVRQARDMIVSAWSNNPLGCKFINQDIFWALITVLQVYPALTKNGANLCLQQYLNNLASQRDQKHVEWKPKGLSGNSGVRYQLASGLMEDFRKTTFWKASTLNQQVSKHVLEALL